MSKNTTITISKELKARMDERKEHPRETYADLIERLLAADAAADAAAADAARQVLKPSTKTSKHFDPNEDGPYPDF